MHAFNPGPLPFIVAVALVVLAVCLLLLKVWVPRIRGWGQIGVLVLLMAICILAAGVATGTGALWWIFA